ncbi:MAG: PaaX family transcriptional regulator C-terminal domain-containing protein [Kangiellaceae bacterium]
MTALDTFIKNRTIQANISCKTFIVTVFGDVISQHGGWVWLGSLIESLSSLGYSERLVRTSVFRLVEDDWLQVKKIGRKSYYGLTQSANNHNKKAARRIYASSNVSDKNNWLIVILSTIPEEKLIPFKRQLKWLGFSSIVNSVFAHPSFDRSSLDETLKELNLLGEVIVFSAKTINEASSIALKKLVFQKWNLAQLQNLYKQFYNDYYPIFELIINGVNLSDHQSFQLRLLIIHEYRRILLSDHELPKAMLPNDWSGVSANNLVKQLYSKLEISSSHYICNSLESFDGFLPLASNEFSFRFK